VQHAADNFFKYQPLYKNNKVLSLWAFELGISFIYTSCRNEKHDCDNMSKIKSLSLFAVTGKKRKK
jgi:hypothetical protein